MPHYKFDNRSYKIIQNGVLGVNFLKTNMVIFYFQTKPTKMYNLIVFDSSLVPYYNDCNKVSLVTAM